MESSELFYIAKHGIMLTGMPAWPTQLRDAEIWPLVAFLEELDKISDDEYRQIVPSSSSRAVDVGDTPLSGILAQCIDCHNADGALLLVIAYRALQDNRRLTCRAR